MRRIKRDDPEPEVRVGRCCGRDCGGEETLYKIPGLFRYRCAACFEKEAGYRHHLSPRPSKSVLVLP